MHADYFRRNLRADVRWVFGVPPKRNANVT